MSPATNRTAGSMRKHLRETVNHLRLLSDGARSLRLVAAHRGRRLLIEAVPVRVDVMELAES